MKNLYTLLIIANFFLGSLSAEVYKVEIDSREDVLGGQEFGDYGVYELLKGKIYFRFDPANPANAIITDLLLAERDKDGYVLAWSDLVVLQPIDPGKRSLALVEVSNRGGKFSLRYFNRATSSQIRAGEADDFGDGLIMRQGLTMIWIGWEFDVPHEDGILRLRVPEAKNLDGSSIYGWVRSDWTVTEYTQFLGLGHRSQVPYPATDFENEGNILTVREGRDAPRQVIPKSKWQFANLNKKGRIEPDPNFVYLTEGFQAGKIYELVYRAKDPVIVGLGHAAIRDVISYAKYNRESEFPVKLGLAAGVSQTGRFLRNFIYQGFNMDEAGRKAYDGLLIITAGAGRGSFNHRFAQPSRDAHRYSAFFYPTDIFPFTSQSQFDENTWKTDGLFAFQDIKYLPNIFYINSGYEYWGRAASLIHMSIDGNKDIEPAENERIYHIASGQHYVDRFPPSENSEILKGIYSGNPLDLSVNYRSLLVAMIGWVRNDSDPPESRVPRLAQGTLVDISQINFPEIPELVVPKVIHTAYRADYGPRWSKGIIDIQPPTLGEQFRPKVAQVDNLGNEIGGIRNVETAVPLATYTPWNLRIGMPGEQNELTDFRGTFIPLPLSEDLRSSGNDSRPSIEALYPNIEAYLNKSRLAAEKLVNEGFILKEDIDYVVERSRMYWNWIHSR